MFSQLLQDMAEDLETLDYSGSELNETVELGKTILVIARSNEENIENFRRNFRNMDQLLLFTSLLISTKSWSITTSI